MKAAVLMMIACAALAACSDAELRSSQQVSKGAALYTKHCANCHQVDGSGLAALIPPLADADYLAANAGMIACIAVHGMGGEITVNGKRYNQAMPENKALSNSDVAGIITFVQHKFLGRSIVVSDSAVFSLLTHCP